MIDPLTIPFAPALTLQSVDHHRFQPFGTLIEMGLPATRVNEGTAMRHDVHTFAAAEAPAGFRLVTSIYNAEARSLHEPVGTLERHPHTLQLIMPLGGEGHAVIVCDSGPDGAPNLATLTGFRFHARQGMIYRRGVWHHPILALDRPTQFLVQSWQNGSDADCEIVSIPPKTVVVDRSAR